MKLKKLEKTGLYIIIIPRLYDFFSTIGHNPSLSMEGNEKVRAVLDLYNSIPLGYLSMILMTASYGAVAFFVFYLFHRFISNSYEPSRLKDSLLYSTLIIPIAGSYGHILGGSTWFFPNWTLLYKLLNY